MTKFSSSFLITAMGRSGTMFLATTMNRSKQWAVAHEPRWTRSEPREVTPPLLAWFDEPYRGQVNSRLRWVAPLLKDHVRLGVIIRNPRDLAKSVYNKYLTNRRNPGFRGSKGTPWDNKIFEASLHAVDATVEAGALVICFEKMTTDATYLEHVLHRFGIDDVDVTGGAERRRVNVNKSPTIKTFDDIPDGPRALLESQLTWFEEKYYGEGLPNLPNQV